MLRLLTLITCTALALGSTFAAQADDNRASFVIIGDTGYIPSYEAYEADEPPARKLGAYLARQADEWLERNPDLTDFTPTPWVFESAQGGYVEASGMYPVAFATEETCRVHGCNFAIMAGDNIYPDGATLGADGISDIRRFTDMLDRPYGRLGADVRNFTIYALLGNHDWHLSRPAAVAQMRYLQKHPNFTMPGFFYRATPAGMDGFVELFVIDTEMLLASTTVYQDKLDADGREIRTDAVETWPDFVKPANKSERQMVSWLSEALATSSAHWKLVIGHHALWSGGGSKFEKAHALRALLMDSLCHYADAYISGDDHMLEVYQDDCGADEASAGAPLTLLVSGAGSKYRPLHPRFMAHQMVNNPGLSNPFSKGATWGLIHVSLEADSLTARVISTPADMSGRPVNEATLRFMHRSD
ncbi:MAG: hypothetical protein Tsb0016_02740 [Sphingomonadales bacterium]